METRKTSYGEMAHILKINGKVTAEYLRFERAGRGHKHKTFESFFVLTGQGKVYSGDEVYAVKPGDLVSIPPGNDHWMEVQEGEEMEGLLWYHEQPISLKSNAQ